MTYTSFIIIRLPVCRKAVRRNRSFSHGANRNLVLGPRRRCEITVIVKYVHNEGLFAHVCLGWLFPRELVPRLVLSSLPFDPLGGRYALAVFTCNANVTGVGDLRSSDFFAMATIALACRALQNREMLSSRRNELPWHRFHEQNLSALGIL